MRNACFEFRSYVSSKNLTFLLLIITIETVYMCWLHVASANKLPL